MINGSWDIVIAVLIVRIHFSSTAIDDVRDANSPFS